MNREFKRESRPKLIHLPSLGNLLRVMGSNNDPAMGVSGGDQLLSVSAQIIYAENELRWHFPRSFGQGCT